MSTAPASTAAFPLEGPHAVETLPLNPNQPQPHPIIATLDSILMISHKPPKHPVAKWIWKQRIRIEVTTALIMLNLWEKILCMSIVGLFFILIYISVVNYLPSHLSFLRNRIAYYVYGDEGASLFWDLVRAKQGMDAGHGSVGLGIQTMTTEAVKAIITGKPEL